MGLLLKIRTIVWGPPAETKAERNLIVKIGELPPDRPRVAGARVLRPTFSRRCRDDIRLSDVFQQHSCVES